jgi:hypothetical protein
MATLRPNWPIGLPTPKALQTATEALCRHYALPETMLHPVVASQALELAYLLSAYGLVAEEPPEAPQFVAANSDITMDTARKLLRAGRVRNRRLGASHPVLADTSVDTMNWQYR